MQLSEIQLGDSIRNNNPYNGEGEYIVVDLSPPLFEDCIKVVAALCEKHPGLNGQASYIDKDALTSYHKVKN